MPVSAPHFLSLMAHKFVNYPLINAAGRQIGSKAMAVRVETDLEPISLAAQGPVSFSHRLPEKPVSPIWQNWLGPAGFAKYQLALDALPLPVN